MNECEHFSSTYYIQRQASYQGTGSEWARLSALTRLTVGLILPQRFWKRNKASCPKPRGQQTTASGAKCQPLPVFVNKTSLEHGIYSFIHSSTCIVSGCFCATTAELSCSDRDCIAYKAKKHLLSGPLGQKVANPWSRASMNYHELISLLFIHNHTSYVPSLGELRK